MGNICETEKRNIYIYIYVYIHICMYIYIYTYIYIYQTAGHEQAVTLQPA